MPAPAGSPNPSVSVECVVHGWHKGDAPLDSHRLCLLLRDGGLRLGEALDQTKQVLDGRDIVARLPFADAASALDALASIGAIGEQSERRGAAAE